MAEENATSATYVEPSITKAFAKLLTNEACHDIVLKCSDGVELGANRCALAMRSPYFEKICLGKFSESKRGVIECKYPSNVMNSVLEYIHIEAAELLSMKEDKEAKGENDGDDDVTQADIDRIQSQVKLDTAAKYYGLPGLSRHIYHCLLCSIRKKPSICFALLETCRQEAPETPEELKSLALSVIRSIDSANVTAKSVGVMSPAALQQILEDDKLAIDDSILFEIVRLWSDSAQTVEEDRLSIATKLVEQHIKLEQIEPGVLSSSVEASGLATCAQLMKAYKEQALSAEKSCGMNFKKPRYVPPYGKWKSNVSNTVTLDGMNTGLGEVLHFAPVTNDKREVHTWTIKIEEADEGSLMWLGVASSDVEAANLATYVGSQNGFWGYASDKFVWLNGNNVRPDNAGHRKGFKAGDEITMTLDLQKEESNFFLRFHVSGSKLVLYRDDFSSLPKPPTGLVPAVSVGKNSRASFRFLSYSCS